MVKLISDIIELSIEKLESKIIFFKKFLYLLIKLMLYNIIFKLLLIF